MSVVEYIEPEPATSIVRRAATGVDIIALCDDYWRLAQRISTTEFVPTALRRRPEAVLAALLSGAERGLGPMESLRSVHVIEGRPTLSAEAMRALVFAAGHTIEIVETNAQRATVIGRRAGSESTSPAFTWTMDRAKRARLAGKGNWQSYPEAMLLARATADLCRALFPDVIAGLAVVEELEDIAAPEPATATATTRRRTPAQIAPVTSIDTAAAETPAAPETPPDVDAAPDPEPVDDDPAAPVDEIPGSDTPSWAPNPTTEPAPPDPGLAKRIHAQIRAALPETMSTRDVDMIRHGLVAVVTRRRPDGPVTSSADLTLEEQVALSELLERAKAGQAMLVKNPDGELELRAHGWRYTITLDPVRVAVDRVDPTDSDTLPLEPEFDVDDEATS